MEMGTSNDNDTFRLPLIIREGFFRLTGDHDFSKDSHLRAKCAQCDKLISGSYNATSNFLRHLKIKNHSDMLASYEEIKYSRTKNRRKSKLVKNLSCLYLNVDDQNCEMSAHINLPVILREEFFTLEGEYTDLTRDCNLRAKCVKCGKVLSGRVSATTNFLNHLKRSHSEMLYEYEELKRQRKAEGIESIEIRLPLILREDFFEICEQDNDSDIIHAKCVQCDKIISGRLDSTSNFLNHLKTRNHSEQLRRYENMRRRSSIPSNGYGDVSYFDDSEICTPGKRPRLQDCTPQIKVEKDAVKKEKQSLEEYIMNYIIGTMSPLNIVQHPDFITLINGLVGKEITVMSRRTLVRKLMDRYENTKTKLSERLQMNDWICATVDIWTIQNKTYLGTTAHVINEDTLERESYALSCCRYDENLVGDKVFEIFSGSIQNFGIPMTKIFKVITDNSGDMLRAFGSSMKETYDIDVDITIFVDEYYDNGPENTLETPFEVEPNNRGESTTSDIDKFIKVEEFENDSSGKNEVCVEDLFNMEETITQRHERCFTYKLNFIACKSMICYDSDYATVFKSSYKKCQEFWKKVSHCTNSREIYVKYTQTSPKFPCITKWNSLFYCFVDICACKEIIIPMFNELGLVPLNDTEFELLNEYIQCMTPVARSLDVLQSPEGSYYGILLPELFRMRKKLDRLREQKFRYCTQLVKQLIAGLNAHFEDYFGLNVNVHDALLASIAHPFFRLRWIPKDRRDELKNIFLDELTSMYVKLDNGVSGQIRLNDQEDYEFEEDDEDKQSMNVARLQGTMYLKDHDASMQTLNNYPYVKKLFVKYNTALPSSSPVERLFSFGNLFMRPSLRKLNDKTFETLLFLKSNRHIID